MHYFGPRRIIPVVITLPFAVASFAHADEPVQPLAMQCPAAPGWVSEQQLESGIAPALRTATARTLFVDADNLDGVRDDYATFYGNVVVRFDQQLVRTDEARYNQETGQLSASGGVLYTDDYVAIQGEQILADTLNQSARLDNVDYYLLGTAARGSAGLLSIQTENDIRALDFADASFTTCPGERPVWEVRANSIQMNENEGWGSARGAQIRLFDVPLVYIPRFSFPITDERKSGLLYPTIGSSSRNGLEIEAPYYFNLAPNYDATLAPRYMSRRGIMGMAEGRYLSQNQRGQVNVEYLNNDTSLSQRNSRSFWRVEHQAQWTNNWSTYIDASEVSDVNYFNDFGSDFANRADAHIYRRGQADYLNNNWQAQLQIEDFQMLGPYQSPYRSVPRLSLWYDTGLPSRQGIRTNWHTELTQFERQGGPEKATRFHTDPGATYIMRRPGWEWSAEGRMLLTHYEQEQIENETLVSRSISRAVPEFRLHGQINLERPLTLGNSTGVQTLQPQAQFLYTPYRDQRDIGVYDSVPLQDDYNGLFRKRRFSGLDRVADANQVTLGATTSIFSQRADELMRLSLGQIFYFSDSETQLFDETTQVADNKSELAADLDFKISSRWFFNTSVQYDNQMNQMQKSRSAVEYRKDDNNLVQLNFRQVRGLIGTETDVEQIGMLGTWQLSQNWAVAGHWYRDMQNGTTLDANFGVQYESCCWAVRLSGYRRIDRNFDGLQTNQALTPAEFDNGVSFQFIITGLSADRSSLVGMLQQGIFGYRRPFYLSN